MRNSNVGWVLGIASFLFGLGLPARASDCNGNGLLDALELATGEVEDCNQNGIPDSCDVSPRVRFEGMQFDLAHGVSSLLLEDFDGDGNADVITTHKDSGIVSVLLNRGDATFSPFGFPAGRGARTIACADFDGDGQLDISTANPVEFGVSILLNSGQGAFSERTAIATEGSSFAVASIDIDADGDVDLLVANSLGTLGQGSILLLRNTGGGDLIADDEFGVGLHPTVLRSADLDGDGRLDLVALNSESNDFSVLLSDGNGGFLPELRTATVAAPRSFEFAELDGNDRLDVILISAAGTISALLNQGPGDLRPADLDGLPNAETIGVADVNGDGRADLLAASDGIGSDTLAVLLNRGPAGFELAETIPIDRVPAFLAGADLDSDGRTDIVTAGERLGVFLNQGGGAFSPGAERLDFGPGLNNSASSEFTEAVDLDLDGYPEIVTTANNELIVFPNNQVEFAPAIGLPNTYSGAYLAETGDFNGDAADDLFLVQRSGNHIALQVIWNTGTVVPPEPIQIAKLTTPPESLTSGDFDSDGDRELLWTHHGNGNLILAQEDGIFDDYQLIVSRGTVAAQPADVDGDGDLDIVEANAQANAVRIHINNGNLDFTRGADHALDASPAWGPMGLADFDGDGDVDIAVGNSQGRVETLLNAGKGAFTAQELAFAAGSIGGLRTADLDGDEDIDLVVERHRAALLVLNDGNANWRALAALPTGGYQNTRVATADFDQDGRIDVAAPGSRAMLISHNTGMPPTAADRNLNGVPDTCEDSFLRGDCNGDGDVSGNVTDALFLVSFNFFGAVTPPCLAACDANGDGQVAGSVTDAVFLLSHVFLDGAQPPAPFPDCAPGTAEDRAIGCQTPLDCP